MKFRIITIILSLLFLPLLNPPHAGAEQGGKRLLIIDSYHDGAPWSQEIINPIISDISKIEEVLPAEVVFLSNTLIHTQEDFERAENAIFDRYADRRPDYLVLVGNFSFTLRDRIVEEWGDVPMLLVAQSDKYWPQEFYYTYEVKEPVGCGEGKPLEELQGKYNFSLVQIPNLYKETIDMMKYMYPEMDKLVFLADALYLNRHLNHEIMEYLWEKYPEMDYEWLMASEENGKLLQQYLNNRDPKIGLLLSTWFFERKDIHGFPQLMAVDARLISGARRPVFGLRYASMSFGIFGGYFPSPQDFIKDIHASLIDMISDKKMSEVPFRKVRSSYPIINYEKLLRCKVPESACPPGTVFINKPKTIWEENKVYIISGCIVFLALVALAVVLLITQRRRIELLRERDSLIGNMPIGYSRATLKRDENGNLTEIEYHGWNDSFGRLLKNNDIPDKPSKLFDSEKIIRFIERLIRDRRTMRFSHHFAPTDTDYEFMASLSNQRNVNEDEVDIFAVDITDQKKKELMLIEAREKAMESDKLKMAFLANMSHEIRTPLNAIVGFSGMLTKTGDPEKKKRFIEIIEQNNELLLKLINDVLDTAKVESNTLDIHIEPVDVNSIMSTVDSTVRLRLKKHVALNMLLGAPECTIKTDPDRLSQVLVNLLTNAMKFTEKGNITFGYELRDKEIYFYVRDTGRGITPEDIGKLFTRFTKLNNFVQGTGLGLSISKSIVVRLGGNIGASSEGKGKGSTFWFTLPVDGPGTEKENKKQ